MKANDLFQRLCWLINLHSNDKEFDVKETYVKCDDRYLTCVKSSSDFLELTFRAKKLNRMKLHTLIKHLMSCYENYENFGDARLCFGHPDDYLHHVEIESIMKLPSTMNFWNFIDQIKGSLNIVPKEHIFTVQMNQFAFDNRSIEGAGSTLNSAIKDLIDGLQGKQILNCQTGEIITVPKKLTNK